MRGARLWVLMPVFLLLGGPGGLSRQAHTAAPARLVENEPDQAAGFEARLDDDSLVRLSLRQTVIEVNTPYGKLSVPVRDVRQIDFGCHPPEGTQRRIVAAAANLGARTFAAREAASKQLLELGPWSYDALLQAARSSDPEVARRGKELVARLEGQFSEERLQRKWHDTVETPTFTIVGRMERATIKVKTSYFGDAEVRLGHLWSLHSLDAPAGVQVVIDSSRYGVPGQTWLQTGIEVRKGAALKITATGQIDMYPLGNEVGMYMATPAGGNWMGGRFIRAGMVVQAQPGTLLGKIGVNGQEFIVGEKWEDKAPVSGKLFFRIVQSPWNNVPKGEYKAKVTVK